MQSPQPPRTEALDNEPLRIRRANQRLPRSFVVLERSCRGGLHTLSLAFPFDDNGPFASDRARRATERRKCALSLSLQLCERIAQDVRLPSSLTCASRFDRSAAVTASPRRPPCSADGYPEISYRSHARASTSSTRRASRLVFRAISTESSRFNSMSPRISSATRRASSRRETTGRKPSSARQ
jgi:hypothetical protein